MVTDVPNINKATKIKEVILCVTVKHAKTKKFVIAKHA
jgi:hypothetical protein